MDKEKVLEAIKAWKVENEIDLDKPAIDYKYFGEDVDNFYYFLEDKLGLPFSLYYRAGRDESWLQCDYFSDKIRKTIVMSHDVGDFDDDDELADFIVSMAEEVKELEDRLTKIDY